MKKNKFKKGLSIALVMAMMAGTIAFTPGRANAATVTVKNVNLGTTGLSNPASPDGTSRWTGSKVYYGNKLWDVLDADNASDGTAGAAFLLEDMLYPLEERAYHDTDEVITWEGCTLRAYLNGTFISNTFTAQEQNEIKTVTVQNPDNPTHLTEGGAETQDKLFLLSVEEATNTSYGFGSGYSYDPTRNEGCQWWIRTPGQDGHYAVIVNNSGEFFMRGGTVNIIDNQVRPAFNLNLDSVFFTSASTLNKSTFASVGTDRVADNEWKLTLKDTDTSFAAILPTSGTIGSNVSVDVTTKGNGSVTYNKTSAMLVDGNGTVVAYGSIGDANLGTKTFTIPSTVPAGTYTLQVFPEQVNGGDLTDYAGQVVSSTITLAAPTYDVAITNPAASNITLSAAAGNGAEVQVGITGTMTPVVYTAKEGYYFPTDYTVTGSNGISVTRNSYTQITVSGTPTANANITLLAATEKTSQSAPLVVGGENKITGTTTAMEYASSETATTWKPCSNTSTTVAAGTWYVRYAATDTKKAGTAAKVVVTAPAPIDPTKTYDVTITNPADSNVTLSAVPGNGAEVQVGITGTMTPVVYTVKEGYYFPADYAVPGSNGIIVTRNSATQITVSGTPTADADITLLAATEKASQSAPSVTGGVNKITGTTTAMEYASSETATTWKPCSDTSTTVAAGTWYVRYAATDTKKAGVAAKVVVTATEPTDPAEPTDPTDPTDPTPSEKDDVPKTGESTSVVWLFVLAIISGTGVVYFGKKKKAVR